MEIVCDACEKLTNSKLLLVDFQEHSGLHWVCDICNNVTAIPHKTCMDKLDLQPIFDLAKLEEALNSPAYKMPSGLSREEKRSWLSGGGKDSDPFTNPAYKAEFDSVISSRGKSKGISWEEVEGRLDTIRKGLTKYADDNLDDIKCDVEELHGIKKCDK